MNICRATHIQRGWDQSAVFEAYNWITRGALQEPSHGSYGDLGLAAGLHTVSIVSGVHGSSATEFWTMAF
jgi:hypothetical protein